MKPESIRKVQQSIQLSASTLALQHRSLTTMPPDLIRRIWGTIEDSATSTLLQFSSPELTQHLAEQLERVSPLTPDESDAVKQYISQRTLLIREIASSSAG